MLKAVQNVHAMIDKEVAAGTDPKNVFVCGFSQGGLSLSFFQTFTETHINKTLLVLLFLVRLI